MQAVYLHAENDYLQFLGEMGVMALILPVLVLVSVYMALQVARQERHIFSQGMSFAATMGIVSLLIHSAVDFNLQIPANGMLFVFLLSMCWIVRFQNQEVS
jgi:O-antigen ligase